MRLRTRREAWAGLALACFLCPAVVRGQAWLPPKGGGAVSLTLGHYAFDGHLAADGRKDPFGGTRAESVWVEGIYALTDRLALSAGLPFVTTKLTGSFPEGVALGPLDDGDYHGDFQDVRFELAFNLLPGDLGITPFVGLGVPSHEYEYVGEAVPGKGLREVLVGLAAGRSLSPLLPRAYVHARYAYAFVETVDEDVPNLDRSNLDAELGYQASSRLLTRVLARWQVTHGGLDLEDMRHHPDFFRAHDRAARTNYFNLGLGAAFALGPSWDVYAIFIQTLSGENAHQSRSLSVGATYYFGGGFGGGPDGR
ncbi:MAG TPA: hypothetical protein VJ648_01160 [Vicinamibacteria bacterium]|nr:hypothetical protein [Vicinamibacteria bacterium]